MLRRTPLRFTAVALTVLVAGAAASPALAATQTATGTAAAIQGSVVGMTVDSMRYTASNDGSGETTSGTNNPPISVLTGQSRISEGTLAQDAVTSKQDGNLSSVACAGVAGQGASLAQVGDGNCIDNDGQTLSLTGSNLDLTNVKVTGSDITDQLPDALKGALSVDQLSPLTDTLNTALGALGNPALSFDLKALQATCSASPGNLSGDANLAGASLIATPPGGDAITLLTLPVDPDPNTPVSATPALLVKALSDSLTKTLTDGAANAGPLSDLFAQLPTGLSQGNAITDAVNAGAEQLSDAIAPLLTGTLNKQTRDDNSIHVTAFDAQLLPAAAAATGGSALASLQIGDVTCSTGTVKPAATTTPTPTPKSNVPTAIDSGLAGDDGRSPVLPIVGGLMLLAGAGIGVRRVLRIRG